MDAARAYDKVARILGSTDLNFPNSDALEINGSRSEASDEAVAVAVHAANTYAATGGKNQTSVYSGVTQDRRNKTHPWRSEIKVSSKNAGCM